MTYWVPWPKRREKGQGWVGAIASLSFSMPPPSWCLILGLILLPGPGGRMPGEESQQDPLSPSASWEAGGLGLVATLSSVTCDPG